MSRILENRTFLILAVLFCAVESVWSWLSTRHVELPENPASILGIVNICFYTFLILAIVSIVYSSRFWGDRVVFGIFAGVMVLIAVEATVPLTRPSMLAVNVAKSSMWTIAVLVSLIVLVRGSNMPLRNKPVTRSDEPGEATH
jgi:uncharacterized protein involved in response to NO